LSAAKPIGSALLGEGKANCRRNFLAGGSFFFTVNLADRRLTLLNDHIDLLRAAFR
jgi:REP element-mobilizing transposase RayT